MGEFAAMVAAISLLCVAILMCYLARLAVKSAEGHGGETTFKIAAGIFRAEFGATINGAPGVGDTKSSEAIQAECVEEIIAPPKVIEQGKKMPEVISGGEHMT